MILAVDIESCSAADIGDGVEPYAEHASTRVWCVVLCISVSVDGTTKNKIARWQPGDTLPAEIIHYIRTGRPVLAHNASFEAAVWEHILTPQFDFPVVALDQWVDTLVLAAAVNLPLGLDALGAAIGAKVVKDAVGAKLMKSLAKVHKSPTGYLYPEPTPEQMERLIDYCEVDVLSTIEIYRRLPRLLPSEHDLLIVDRVINHRGAQLDLATAEAMVRMANLREAEIAREIWDQTNDLIGMTNVPAFTKWLKDRGIVLPKVTRRKVDGTFHQTDSIDRTSMAEILERPELPAEVRAALLLRVEAGRVTSLAKAARIPSVVSADGRLRNALRFCRAHTGRWSSEGLQLHNLARPSKEFKIVAAEFRDAVRAGDIRHARQYFSVLDGLSFMLRSLVIAAPGCELIGGDFSGIEARVLAWAAGQHDKLRVFADYDAAANMQSKALLDPYVIAAARIGSTDRQLGKVAELGLGYGMGVIKFRDSAAKAGVVLTLKRAREVQQAWRKVNNKIVDLWHNLQDAVAEVIKERGKVIRVGPLAVGATHECLKILLPSARVLHYWQPHQRDVIREFETVNREGEIVIEKVPVRELCYFTPGKRGMEREVTYGGRLTENVVQAIARDLLGAALVRLHRHGFYRVVLHVHDSIASEVPAGTGSVPEFCQLMAFNPPWAAGLPTAVDGYRSGHFKG